MQCFFLEPGPAQERQRACSTHSRLCESPSALAGGVSHQITRTEGCQPQNTTRKAPLPHTHAQKKTVHNSSARRGDGKPEMPPPRSEDYFLTNKATKWSTKSTTRKSKLDSKKTTRKPPRSDGSAFTHNIPHIRTQSIARKPNQSKTTSDNFQHYSAAGLLLRENTQRGPEVGGKPYKRLARHWTSSCPCQGFGNLCASRVLTATLTASASTPRSQPSPLL